MQSATALEAGGGNMLGPYRVLERLGATPSATVVRALREGGDGNALEVYLKYLHPQAARNRARVRELALEARLGTRLRHPNLRRLFGGGELDGTYYIVGEFIEGRSLRALRNDDAATHPLPVAAALSIVVQLCGVLEYLHILGGGSDRPLVHGSLTPSKVVIADDGAVKLVDIGIGPFDALHAAGYVAPEVVAGARPDARADVFSVGAMARELLGLQARGPGSRSRLPGISSIIERALAPDPAERWPSAAAMKQAILEATAVVGTPLSRSDVAGWAYGRWDRSPTDDEDFTTRVLRLPRPTSVAPVGPSLPSRGLSSTAVVAGATRPKRDARRMRVLAVLLGASLGVNGALVGALATGSDRATAGETSAAAGESVERRVSPEASGADLAARSEPAPPRPLAPPVSLEVPVPSGEPESPRASLVKRSGVMPRSRASRAPWRATICVNARGRVVEVTVLEAPARLHRRLRRVLRRWRYRPQPSRPERSCIEVSGRFRRR